MSYPQDNFTNLRLVFNEKSWRIWVYVYFITTQKSKGGGKRRLKIGRSKNPEARMKTLQTGSAQELKLQGVIRCDSDRHSCEIEKAAHEYFRDHHIRGEWFRLTDMVITEVWQFCIAAEKRLLKEKP